MEARASQRHECGSVEQDADAREDDCKLHEDAKGGATRGDEDGCVGGQGDNGGAADLSCALARQVVHRRSAAAACKRPRHPRRR